MFRVYLRCRGIRPFELLASITIGPYSSNPPYRFLELDLGPMPGGFVMIVTANRFQTSKSVCVKAVLRDLCSFLHLMARRQNILATLCRRGCTKAPRMRGMSNNHRRSKFTPSDDALIRQQPVTGISIKPLATILRTNRDLLMHRANALG